MLKKTSIKHKLSGNESGTVHFTTQTLHTTDEKLIVQVNKTLKQDI